jgi:O-antigen chain-terminating methyltransferase
MSATTFYRAFEDRYRGDRDVIKQRLRAYTPFLDSVSTLSAGAAPRALDLGCGRGEWLELLGEQGLQARGVDLDAGMLAACEERGLQVELTDAVAALRACADGSLALVSAFHLVEHVPFAVLQTLIGEALRVLQPGGLLIMETPNPENLSVGATSFYLDPSHEKPLPPMLLGFLADYAGYARQRTVRLQEPAALHQPDHQTTLIDVLENVSPDYAIVAQKAAPAAVLAAFDAAWAGDYGYALGELAQRYEATGAARLAELHQGLAHQAEEVVALNRRHAATAAELSAQAGAYAQLATLEQRAADNEARLAQLGQQQLLDQQHQQQQQQQLAELATRVDQANHATQAALAHAHALHQQLQAVYASTSWRLTKPYRYAGGVALRVRSDARRRLRGPLLQLMRAVLRQPLLKGAARRLLARFPGMQARLRGMLYQPVPGATTLPPEPLPSDGDLSPRAARAYQELKNTLEKREARTH